MFDMKTASEARKYSEMYYKQNRERQLRLIASHIEDAVWHGTYNVGPYKPNYFYPETINTLNSLGYAINYDDSGRGYISWEK